LKDKKPEYKNTPKIATKTVATETPITVKRLEDVYYEQIIKGFKDSEIFAINNKQFDFLDDYLENGSTFEKKVKEDINKQTGNQKLDYVKFMEFVKMEKDIHVVKAEISINGTVITSIFKIRKSSDKYKIIDEAKQ
jgi:hypothetical protein